jgi:hypothetical protein
MPDKAKGPSNYINQQRAAELHEGAAHAHLAAEQRGKSEHLTGTEHSRQEMEHVPGTQGESHTAPIEHGVQMFGHHEIEALAYELWETRGRPDGSPEVDWHQAVHNLRARPHVR